MNDSIRVSCICCNFGFFHPIFSNFGFWSLQLRDSLSGFFPLARLALQNVIKDYAIFSCFKKKKKWALLKNVCQMLFVLLMDAYLFKAYSVKFQSWCDMFCNWYICMHPCVWPCGLKTNVRYLMSTPKPIENRILSCVVAKAQILTYFSAS